MFPRALLLLYACTMSVDSRHAGTVELAMRVMLLADEQSRVVEYLRAPLRYTTTAQSEAGVWDPSLCHDFPRSAPQYIDPLQGLVVGQE